MDNQEHQNFIAERKKIIGGSDIAAVINEHPFKTKVDLYFDKIGEGTEIPDNAAMKAGRKLEPIVADYYAEETGRKVRNEFNMRLHKKYNFLGANIDRLILANDDGRGTGILECKTTNSFYKRLWADEVPLAYYLQLQWYIGIFGYNWGALALLVDGREFVYYEYNFDSELFETLVKEAVSFWENHVVKRIPPEAKTASDIKLLYPQHEAGKAVEAADYTLTRLRTLGIKKNAEKSLKKEIEELETEIKLAIGDAEILTDTEGTPLATFKTTNSGRFDTKSFQKEHEDLFKNFYISTNYRTLRLNNKNIGV